MPNTNKIMLIKPKKVLNKITNLLDETPTYTQYHRNNLVPFQKKRFTKE